MADVITGDAEIAASKMTLIVAMAQKELAQAAKLLPTITDVSHLAEAGLNQISFPDYGSFTVTKKTSKTAVDAQALTASVDTLALSEEAVIQWIIEKKQAKQSRNNLEAEFAIRAAAALGREVDVDIITALEAGAAAGNAVAGLIASGITNDDILEMRMALDDAFVPEENRTLVVLPLQEKEMLLLDKFTSADYIQDKPLVSGFIGRIYGINVVKHTGLTANIALMYHKECCVFGMQSEPEYDNQKDLANLGVRYSIDQLYGLKVLKAGVMISKLTLGV